MPLQHWGRARIGDLPGQVGKDRPECRSDFSPFVEKYGTSKLVDVSNPGSIAQAINSFLEDAEDYDRCRRNVKEAFLSEFNFEKQIEPVFKWLDNLKVK